jgi:hypothetical protein
MAQIDKTSQKYIEMQKGMCIFLAIELITKKITNEPE